MICACYTVCIIYVSCYRCIAAAKFFFIIFKYYFFVIIITIISDIITTLFYLAFITMASFSTWLRYSSSCNPHHYYLGMKLSHTKHFRMGQNQIVQVNLSVPQQATIITLVLQEKQDRTRWSVDRVVFTDGHPGYG